MPRRHDLILLAVPAIMLGLIWDGSPSQKAPENGAVVWYLGHCGYAVKIRDHLLIFDYQETRDGQQPKVRPVRPSLDAGWINPDEIKASKVRVFVSHSHEDHYDPIILEWKNTIPDIAYYFGWKFADAPAYHSLAGPRAEIISGDLEIATINSHHSGVPEVAWLVKTGGLVIYHNGDCQPDDPASAYDFLRKKAGRIDIAFVFPVYEDGEQYTRQNLALFERFSIRAAMPMHARAGDPRYMEFKKAFEAKIAGLAIHVPMKMGERFTYLDGRVQK